MHEIEVIQLESKKLNATPVLVDVLKNKNYGRALVSHQLLLLELVNDFHISLKRISRLTKLDYSTLVSLAAGTLQKISLAEYSRLLRFYCHLLIEKKCGVKKNNSRP